MPQPWIYLKYVGACVINVNSPHIPPHCAITFIQRAFAFNISIHGVATYNQFNDKLFSWQKHSKRCTITLTRCREVARDFSIYSRSFGWIRGCNAGLSNTKKYHPMYQIVPIIPQKWNTHSQDVHDIIKPNNGKFNATPIELPYY